MELCSFIKGKIEKWEDDNSFFNSPYNLSRWRFKFVNELKNKKAKKQHYTLKQLQSCPIK